MITKNHNYSENISPREIRHNRIAYEAALEGIVLLENDGTLPLINAKKIALYGTGAIDTVSGGTGSGDVNNRKNISIYEGLINSGYEITSEKWLEKYKKLSEKLEADFDEKIKKAIPFKLKENTEFFFGHVPVPELIVEENDLAAADAAVYVIARQAGENGDRKLEKGDYYISDIEKKSIILLAEKYEKFIVIINSGSVIDMGWFDEVKGINAVFFYCQQGSQGGNALADLISGKANPSAKLTDTWPSKYEDIPYGNAFGDLDSNPKKAEYKEGVYVGYRYYDAYGIKPRYHFGYGLSYTSFKIDFSGCNSKDSLTVTVTNTGALAGKEVILYYSDADPSVYEKPVKVLSAFAKTRLLAPNETQVLTLNTLNGILNTSAQKANEPDFTAKEKACAILSRLKTRDKINLVTGAGQFSNKRIIKTEGAVGHTTSSLYKKFGIKNMELADGPAGLRLERVYGVYPNGKTKMVTAQFEILMHLPRWIKKVIFANPEKSRFAYQFASRFPVETAQAQSFNPELIEKIGRAISDEMTEFEISYFLAPAVNIHKNPLCGRNFEYYSEDPFLSGMCASALIKGIQSIPGHFATIKHFCCNNQEADRNHSDSVVDIATLKEIYLKAFEIAVKASGVKAVMTSYNLLNGTHTAENRFLITDILRGEWGFDGVVMTDWYSSMQSDAGNIIAAGGDMIMPGNALDKNAIKKAIKKGVLEKNTLDRACLRILKQYFENKAI